MVIASEAQGALDIWNLLVNNVFGGFWLATFGVMFMLFLIMAILGRMSIYTTMWFLIMFLLVMCLGYGLLTLTLAITVLCVVIVYLAVKGYIDRGAQ
jgi:hypothetical protein